MSAKAKAVQGVEAPASTKREIGSSTFTLAQTIGERIKWARERKDMTQKELGRLAGKSRASIVQYENGNITAPIDVIADLANALFVAPEYLAFGRSGVPGVKNAEEEIQTFTELKESGTTLIPTGGWQSHGICSETMTASSRSCIFTPMSRTSISRRATAS